jgi:hypothetical protein
MQRNNTTNFKGLRNLKDAKPLSAIARRVLPLAAIASLSTTGLLSTFSKPAQAADQFDTNGIQFDVDTIIEFEFVQSHGAYQSTFGVVNLDTNEKTPLISEARPADNSQDVTRPSEFRPEGELDPRDFTGTPGNAVPQPLAEFEFKANTRYAFYLESTYNGRPAGIVYSTTTLNRGGNQQAKFNGNFTSLGNGGTINLWDDTGSLLVRPDRQDTDYNDFVVRAGGHLACPWANSKQNAKAGSYKTATGLKCTGK